MEPLVPPHHVVREVWAEVASKAVVVTARQQGRRARRAGGKGRAGWGLPPALWAGGRGGVKRGEASEGVGGGNQ